MQRKAGRSRNYWRVWVSRYICPYLKADVELSQEGAAHIAERHPERLPEHQEWIAETLAARIRFEGVFGLGVPDFFSDIAKCSARANIL